MLQYEALSHKKKLIDIWFGKKMANKDGKVVLLTTKFYKSTNDADILVPDKRNP